MHRTLAVAFIAVSLALAACSDYSSGGGTGITPPVQPGTMNNQLPGASPGAGHPGAGATQQATPTPSAPPGDEATYAFADVENGVRCPDVNGYSCIIRLDVTPAPSHPGARPAAATPSPTPTPTSTPSSSASGSPQPTPSATPSMTLHLEARPHDAPAMVNPNGHGLAPTSLIAVRVTSNEDIPLHGAASIDFILPQGQLGGRGFAAQLFHETIERRNRHSDTFVGSSSSATTNGTTLHFAMSVPQVTIKHGETWLLVLYASELPTPSPAPTSSPSAAPSPSAPASTSP